MPVSTAPWGKPLTLLALGYGLLGVIFAATFANMIGVWNHSSTFNHCFLIPFIALYMGYDKRSQLATMRPAVAVYGLLYVALNSLLWLVGELMSVAVFMHAAVVGMIIGLAWTLLGKRVFRVLAFPFFYLYFAVPEGEFLVPYLQDWTAVVVVKLLQLTGIPVFLEGRYLTIPSGDFVVAEACSGVNYLIATLSVGTMFMYLQFRSWLRRALFMVAAIVVPLLANGVRAYGIVMISYLSNYKYAQGIDHFIYGWLFFGAVIFVLFSIGNRFSDVGRDEPALSIPFDDASNGGNAVVALLQALLAAGLPPAALRLLDSARPLAAEIALPSVPNWAGPAREESLLGSKFPGADQSLTGRYQSADGHTVTLDAVYFRKQGERGELVNQTNAVFDKKKWKQVDYGERRLPAGAPIDTVGELRLRSAAGDDFLVWYWYDSHGKRSVERLPIKLAEGLARLAGRNDGGAFVALITPVRDQENAATQLETFIASGGVTVEHMHGQP